MPLTACVVIPIYKKFADLHQSEIISLNQCFKILSKYDIWFVSPEGLNFYDYISYATSKGKNCNIKHFDPIFFKSIDGYNILLKSILFYESFRQYEYMLMYQTDAYVFKDELIKWCNKGYDYIGAPWLEGWTNNSSQNIIGVGNGGFSLNNINTRIRVLRKLKSLFKLLSLIDRATKRKGIDSINKVLRNFFITYVFKISNKRYFNHLNTKDKTYEDIFWGEMIPATFGFYKVASIQEALKFSFEVNPQLLYKLNNYTLPFGCHAWLKYDPHFWEEHIKEEG